MNLKISSNAARKLLNILSENPEKFAGIRLYVMGIGCSGVQYGMAMVDTPEENDHFEQCSSITVVIDPESSKYTDGCVIDWLESEQGAGFTVINKQHAAACGSEKGDSSCGGCAANN